MLPLKTSRKEQHSVIRFLWAKCHGSDILALYKLDYYYYYYYYYYY